MLPECRLDRARRSARALPLQRRPNPVAPCGRPIDLDGLGTGNANPVILELGCFDQGHFRAKAERHSRIEIRREIVRNSRPFFGNRRFFFKWCGCGCGLGCFWHSFRISIRTIIFRVFPTLCRSFTIFLPFFLQIFVLFREPFLLPSFRLSVEHPKGQNGTLRGGPFFGRHARETRQKRVVIGQ